MTGIDTCKFCGGNLNGRGEWRACQTCGKYCREKCPDALSVRGWNYEPCVSCEHNPYRLRHVWGGKKWVVRE